MDFSDILKKIIAVVVVLAIAAGFVYVGSNFRLGNKRVIDLNYTYDRAMIRMPDGNVLDIEIADWSDYEGEQIQVVDKAGNVFLVSSYNCVLVKSGKSDK